LGATAACSIRCAEGCHQCGDSLKDIMKGDAWFGSVKCATNLGSRGRAGFLQIKPNHGLLPKIHIEGMLKNTPGGIYIVLKGTHDDVDIIAMHASLLLTITWCLIAKRKMLQFYHLQGYWLSSY